MAVNIEQRPKPSERGMKVLVELSPSLVESHKYGRNLCVDFVGSTWDDSRKREIPRDKILHIGQPRVIIYNLHREEEFDEELISNALDWTNSVYLLECVRLNDLGKKAKFMIAQPFNYCRIDEGLYDELCDEPSLRYRPALRYKSESMGRIGKMGLEGFGWPPKREK